MQQKVIKDEIVVPSLWCIWVKSRNLHLLTTNEHLANLFILISLENSRY
jgi:hypothetical protein